MPLASAIIVIVVVVSAIISTIILFNYYRNLLSVKVNRFLFVKVPLPVSVLGGWQLESLESGIGN